MEVTMAKATTNADVPLQASAIVQMKQEQRISEFASRDKAYRRMFSELGKLFHFIALQVPRGESVTKVLRDAGISSGTISNATYGHKAYAYVESGAFTEAEYDGLTFKNCVGIAKIAAAKPKQAFQLIQDAVTNGNEGELNCWADNGMSLADYNKPKKDKPAAQTEEKKADETAGTATPPDNVVQGDFNPDGKSQEDIEEEGLKCVRRLAKVLEKLDNPAPVIEALMKVLDGEAAPKQSRKKAA